MITAGEQISGQNNIFYDVNLNKDLKNLIDYSEGNDLEADPELLELGYINAGDLIKNRHGELGEEFESREFFSWKF